MNTNTLTETEVAKAFHSHLATIDITEIPVMSNDRHLIRKEQAKLARELFKKLGIKDVSVTTPTYSMASSVYVSMPQREDYVFDAHGFVADRHTDAASIGNNEANDRMHAILLAAFPNHDDRSDYQTDYFDSKWSLR